MAYSSKELCPDDCCCFYCRNYLTKSQIVLVKTDTNSNYRFGIRQFFKSGKIQIYRSLALLGNDQVNIHRQSRWLYDFWPLTGV